MSFTYHHIDKWMTANLDLIEEQLETQKKAVVLIAGASSSGKSYCASFLEELLSRAGHKAVTISLDQYNVGVSHIIPNKVAEHYFGGKMEHLREISDTIKSVIKPVDFTRKYEKDILAAIRKKIAKYFSDEKDLDQFVNALYTEWKVLNFDEPSVYDLKEAGGDILRLLEGEKVRAKSYSKVYSERVDSNVVIDGSECDVILVEGIYALNSALVDALGGIKTIKNFIDSNPKTLFLRRIIRDYTSTSASSVFTIGNYFKFIVPSYVSTILPCKKNADVVLYNEMSFSEMREGQLYTTKLELSIDRLSVLQPLKKNANVLDVTYSKDTYFSVEGESSESNNILRLRSISHDGGKTYQPSSLVHKGLPKIRLDSKVIRPINVFLKEGEFPLVWKDEESCLNDFLSAGFLIGPVQKKVKTHLIYKGQKITVREVDNRVAYIEFDDPVNPKVLIEIHALLTHAHELSE